MKKNNEEIESIKVKIEESNSCQAEESKSNGMRWAYIVKRNANTDESLIKNFKALNNSAKDLTNFEEQERLLIFFIKVESKKDNFMDRQDEDEKFINDFISEGLHLPSQPIQSLLDLVRFLMKK